MELMRKTAKCSKRICTFQHVGDADGQMWHWEPIDLDPVTHWCFNHQEGVFIEVGTANLICSRHLRSPCDVAEAAVVRMENE